ncbi:PstC family ABC transporter permease [Streptomyces nojiriensis]|uniref:PstC family ABC transporter permease n=1 Tax=Streptomyces nojiriensis TaxID=66374 RepID=UPI0035DC69D3
MTTATTTVVGAPEPAERGDAPRSLAKSGDPADRIFRGSARGAGATVLLVMTLVGVFLGGRALQALTDAGPDFLTTSAWEPDSHHFGIATVLTGTVLIGAVAIVFAVPLAAGTALYITEYAPRRLKQTLISLVDLMAAVPSVVYGLWGLFLFQPSVVGLSRWLTTYFGWFPLFAVDGDSPRDPLSPNTFYTSSTFIAGMVVALMVTPIACSVMREAFAQAPPGEREGAFALGATQWG